MIKGYSGNKKQSFVRHAAFVFNVLAMSTFAASAALSRVSDNGAKPKRLFLSDLNHDGKWDLLKDDSSGTVIHRTVAGDFDEIKIQYFDPDYVTEIELKSKSKLNKFILWKVRVRPYAIFYAESTNASAQNVCSINDTNGQPSNLKVTADEIERSLKEGCSIAEVEKAHSALEKVLNGDSKNPTYFACAMQLQAEYSAPATIAFKRQSHLAESGKEQAIRCEREVSSSSNRLAKFEERGESIVLKTSALEKHASEKTIERLLFHELLHSGGLDDSKIDAVEKCCLKSLERSNPDCKALLPAEDSAPKEGPGTMTRPGDSRTGITKPTHKAVEGKDASRSKVEKKQDSEVTSVAKLAPARQSFLDAAEHDRGFAKRMLDESRQLRQVAEPARRLAQLSLLPRAEAAIQKLTPDTHTVPSEISTSRIERIDRATNSSHSPDENETGASAQTGTTVTESRSITPSAIETRISSVDKNGTPQLELNGKAIPSFQAFKGLTSNPSVLPISSGESAESNTGSAPQANILVGANRPQRGLPAASAGEAALANSLDRGTGSVGGDSGSSFGASRARAIDSRRQNRQPSSQGSAATEPTVLTTADLKPRAHSVQSLESVPVQTSSDVMRVIKAANQPRELLKQQWFVQKLQSDSLRIQIIDGSSQPIGSQNPRTRWNLPMLLRDPSP